MGKHESSSRRRSYKGSHLALMVEILAGALAGGAVQDKVQSANWGNLIVAIDPGKLGAGTQDFSAKVAALLQRLKGARLAPGVKEVLLPGERGSRCAGDAAGASHRTGSAWFIIPDACRGIPELTSLS